MNKLPIANSSTRLRNNKAEHVDESFANVMDKFAREHTSSLVGGGVGFTLGLASISVSPVVYLAQTTLLGAGVGRKVQKYATEKFDFSSMSIRKTA